jgi:alpha,alpha-trehalose-phosphate synthase [UDP-forming]
MRTGIDGSGGHTHPLASTAPYQRSASAPGEVRSAYVESHAGRSRHRSWAGGVGPQIHGERPIARNTLTNRRLMVISNRLPLSITKGKDGNPEARPSSGGLVTALRPVLAKRGGSWTGWAGICDHPDEEVQGLLPNGEEKFRLRAIPLSARERDEYYLGFANQTLWPLFHGFSSLTDFRPDHWKRYRRVNWKFATHLDKARNGDFLWVHDYHLLLFGKALRLQGHRHTTGFFLHTPFPSPGVLSDLPCHQEILDGLLHYDFVSFQTERDQRNFLDCVSELVEPSRRNGRRGPGQCNPVVAFYPISVDFDEWSTGAAKGAVTERVREIRKSLGGVSQLLLGVDRLDYSKGIPAKLRGLREALRRYPELGGNVRLLQLLIPSREGIAAYQREKALIERLAQDVNEEFGRPGWEPVQLIHGKWDRDELMAHYRAADVALVTPLRDGMNLVAKEYCASRVEEPGKLVLSKHAGAAAQLSVGAYLVDPEDENELAEAIHRAVTAPLQEARERMERMRRNVRQEDVHWWADSFLQAVTELGPRRAEPLRARLDAPLATRRRQLSPGPIAALGRG